MTKERIEHIIASGEGIRVEFKKSKRKLNKDAFDSICSFLNRDGGYLVLGVKDDGRIEGIDEDAVQLILDSIATNSNNPLKLKNKM